MKEHKIQIYKRKAPKLEIKQLKGFCKFKDHRRCKEVEYLPNPLPRNHYMCLCCKSEPRLKDKCIYCQKCSQNGSFFQTCPTCYNFRLCTHVDSGFDKETKSRLQHKKYFTCKACRRKRLRRKEPNLWGCVDCNYEYCEDCSKIKLCHKEHILHFSFIEISGYETTEYKCRQCNKRKVSNLGLWACTHPDCCKREYMICPDCWGVNEKQYHAKVESQLVRKQRNRRNFGASDDDYYSEDDEDDLYHQQSTIYRQQST